MPHMNELRDRRAVITASGQEPDTAVEQEWKALHQLSVRMNAAVLLCALTLVFLIVYARVV
jgi:hypothetical protein